MKPQTRKRKLKPSGIDWIGDVPEGWGVERVKYTGWYRNGLTYSPEDVCEDGEGTLVLRSSNIQQGKLDFEDVVFVDKVIPRELKTKLYDIIICSRNGSSDLIGKNALVDSEDPMTFGAFMMCYRPDEFAPRFAYWLLNSCVFKYYLSSFTTSTVNQLTGADFGNIKAPLPPFDEQKRIAEKLDRLCGRVDELTENLKGEIAALQEYRKSLITECVTKGLNPKAKMKPSGVEWIGKIPAGWTVMRTKYVSRVQTGPFGTQLSADSYTEDGSGVPCVNVKNIGDGVFRVDDLDRVQEDVAERLVNYEIKRGDVIFARKGSVDKRTVAEDEQDGWILGSDSIGVRFDEDVLPRYACYYYGNDVMGQHLHKMAKGSTMPSMNAEIIGNLEIIIPPFDEQCRIAALLDEKCAVIDAKIAERKGQLEKLTEYRSAVIYEYVTGKKEVAA